MAEHRYTFRRRVEFADTDVAGIMHFSNYFRFMEVAEHAFYRSLGFSVHDFQPVPEGPRIGWPRVHASCDFFLPLKFEEEVEIEVVVEEVRSKSIRYQFRFWKPATEEPRLAAVGRFSVVCVSFDEVSRKMKALEIPDAVREKIEAAPPEVRHYEKS